MTSSLQKAKKCPKNGENRRLVLEKGIYTLLRSVCKNRCVFVSRCFWKGMVGKIRASPAHYFSSPGLNWDPLFKKTGAELEMLTDLEMCIYIETGMRGDISVVCKCTVQQFNLLISWRLSLKRANKLYNWLGCEHRLWSGRWAFHRQKVISNVLRQLAFCFGLLKPFTSFFFQLKF